MKTVTHTAMILFLILLRLTLTAQSYSVTGKITSKTTGEEIIQMSVVENNTGIGTISSENGDYSLLLKPGQIYLKFSDERYETWSVSFTLKSDTTLNISLNPVPLSSNRKIKRDLQKHEVHSAFVENPVPQKK